MLNFTLRRVAMAILVAITVSLIVVLNLMFYLLVMQQWGYAADDMLGGSGAGPNRLLRIVLIVSLTLETLGFAVAATYLARLTSHRIAGPYIALQKTCERIRDGETTLRQRFRQYDRLEELQTAFNDMLDTLCPPKEG